MMINSSKIINYFVLMRLPNIFTTTSDILLGYFFLSTITSINNILLLELISISASLYIGGIVLNDYHDIKVDKLQRPWRPLPANKISNKNALLIVCSSLSSSIFLSIIVSFNTFIITLSMVFLIFIYNYYSKNTLLGPLNMGAIRSLNILLGSSPYFFLLEGQILDIKFLVILFLMFMYICAITILSRNETNKSFHNSLTYIPFLIIYAIIAFIFLLVIFEIINVHSLINLSLFTSIVIYSHLSFMKSKITLEKVIRNLLILIIVFDSIFITDLIGLQYGLITLGLIIPIILLSRRMYLT